MTDKEKRYVWMADQPEPDPDLYGKRDPPEPDNIAFVGDKGNPSTPPAPPLDAAAVEAAKKAVVCAYRCTDDEEGDLWVVHLKYDTQRFPLSICSLPKEEAQWTADMARTCLARIITDAYAEQTHKLDQLLRACTPWIGETGQPAVCGICGCLFRADALQCRNCARLTAEHAVRVKLVESLKVIKQWLRKDVSTVQFHSVMDAALSAAEKLEDADGS